MTDFVYSNRQHIEEYIFLCMVSERTFLKVGGAAGVAPGGPETIEYNLFKQTGT